MGEIHSVISRQTKVPDPYLFLRLMHEDGPILHGTNPWAGLFWPLFISGTRWPWSALPIRDNACRRACPARPRLTPLSIVGGVALLYPADRRHRALALALGVLAGFDPQWPNLKTAAACFEL
jgi:hypothetical protein